MRVYPCLSDLVHTLPALFTLYLAALALLWLFPTVCCPVLGDLARSPWGWGPLALFVVLALATGVSTVSWHRRWVDLLRVPALILARHVAYGIGMIAGVFTPLHKPSRSPIEIHEAVHTPRGWRLKRR
jgi:hypothetical protein